MAALAAPAGAGRALPFITVDDAGRFAVAPEALALLRSLTCPVAPVCVAGRYRSGKSFLLNALVRGGGGGGGGGADAPPAAAAAAAASPAAFRVGGTVEACTRGLWLWSEPERLPGGACVLWVDSEGLGATSSGAGHDARVFALACLLSSALVYNSVGTIDEDAVGALGFVAQLARHLEGRTAAGAGAGAGAGVPAPAPADDDGGAGGARLEAAEPFFPALMWVVRDFTLSLADGEDGTPGAPRDYLEAALAPARGYAPDVAARNRTRRALAAFFPRRDAAVLVRPVDDEAALQALDALPPGALRREFVDGLADLRARLLAPGFAPPKTAARARAGGGGGEPATGRVLAALALAFTAAVNAGGVPDVAGAWEAAAAGETAAAGDDGRAALEAALAAARPAAGAAGAGGGGGGGEGPPPLDEPALDAALAAARAAALTAFDARALGPGAPAARAALSAAADAAAAAARADNAAASAAFCGRLAARLWAAHVEPALAAGGEPDAVAAGADAFRAAFAAAARGPGAPAALARAALDGLVAVARGAGAARAAAAAAAAAAAEEAAAAARADAAAAGARAGVLEAAAAGLRAAGAAGALALARAEAAAAAARADAARAAAARADAEVQRDEAAVALAEERRAGAEARVAARMGGAGGAAAAPPPPVRNPRGVVLDIDEGDAAAGGGSGAGSPLPLAVSPRVDTKFRQHMKPEGAGGAAGGDGAFPAAHPPAGARAACCAVA